MEESHSWLLSYYDGDNSKLCIIDSISSTDVSKLITWMVDTKDYQVNTVVHLLPTQLDSNIIDNSIVWNDDTWVRIYELPCYRPIIYLFEDSSDGDCIVEVFIYDAAGNEVTGAF